MEVIGLLCRQAATLRSLAERVYLSILRSSRHADIAQKRPLGCVYETRVDSVGTFLRVKSAFPVHTTQVFLEVGRGLAVPIQSKVLVV